jgi:anti-sigma-K factor RskA
MLATAAAVLAVVGTLAVVQLATGRTPAAEVTARATLNPLAASGARGDAEVLGDTRLRVDASGLPLTTGYYEVWLLNADDTTKMQSLGSLPANTQAVLPIPPGTDLRTYRLVDVSVEPHDGNSAHSGDSLLRGTLTN